MTQPRNLAGYPSEFDATWHFTLQQRTPLFVVFFHTRRALTGNSQRPPPPFINLQLSLQRTAGRLLAPHGIDLQQSPLLGGVGSEPLPFDDDVSQDPTQRSEQLERLREMVDLRIANALFPRPVDVQAPVPVVFITFEFGDTGRADSGLCVSFRTPGLDQRGYVFINVYNHASDDGTLLHELGHCAGLRDVFLSSDDADLQQDELAAKYALLPVMLVEPVAGRPRTGLTRDEVEALAKKPLGPPTEHQSPR